MNDYLAAAIEKLRLYAAVRDRGTEKQQRFVVLSDDEALALLEELERNAPEEYFT